MKTQIFARPVLGASLISLAVLLAACGGGEDATMPLSPQGETAQAALTTSTTATRATTSTAATTAQPVATSADIETEAVPAPWEMLEDAAATRDYEARLQALQPGATEHALAVADTRVKWNPGHYIAINGTYDDVGIKTTLAEIKPFPQVKGMLMRYGWRQLEPNKGVYNFSTLDRDVALAASQGKRIFIMIGTKAFQSGAKAVPDYMHTAEYGGGGYKIKIGAKDTLGTGDAYGENMALYNNGVRDRLIALTSALAARYNRHNAVEGIAFNETSLGDALVPLTSAQKTAFFTNTALLDAATRRAWPNSVVMQFINFPRPYMPTLVNSMIGSGTALGGPDTFFHDSDLNNYVYPLYDVATGKVPVGPSVQPENYLTTYQSGPYNPPAVKDLHAFAKTRLHANYLFWTRSMTKPLVPYAKLLDYFRSSTFPKDASGGLNTACPTTIASCVAKL